MTVLGQKVSHRELDAVCTIKPDELYLKAKVAKVAFQDFHNWIEKEISMQYLKSLYLTTDTSTEPDEVFTRES